MRHSRKLITGFSIAGSLLLLYIALPLASIILGSSADRLWKAVSEPEVLRSLVLTFSAASLATLIAFFGGVPLAYLLARRTFPVKRMVEALIDLPVVIPHTAAGIALLMVFGSKGIIGKPLAQIGFFFTDSLAGIVTAMLFVGLPYFINMSREAFALIDPEMENTALVEGATPWQAFLHVTLPLAWRGIIGGGMMMWARGISEFGAVVILAYHPKIMPVLIYELFTGFGLTAAQPVAAILIVFVLLFFILLRWLVMPSKGMEGR